MEFFLNRSQLSFMARRWGGGRTEDSEGAGGIYSLCQALYNVNSVQIWGFWFWLFFFFFFVKWIDGISSIKKLKTEICQVEAFSLPPPPVWNLMCKIYLFQARKCVQSNRHPAMYLSKFATGLLFFFFFFILIFVFMSFLLNCHCSICLSEKKHDVTDAEGRLMRKWKSSPQLSGSMTGCFNSRCENKGLPLKGGR